MFNWRDLSETAVVNCEEVSLKVSNPHSVDWPLWERRSLKSPSECFIHLRKSVFQFGRISLQETWRDSAPRQGLVSCPGSVPSQFSYNRVGLADPRCRIQEQSASFLKQGTNCSNLVLLLKCLLYLFSKV